MTNFTLTGEAELDSAEEQPNRNSLFDWNGRVSQANWDALFCTILVIIPYKLLLFTPHNINVTRFNYNLAGTCAYKNKLCVLLNIGCCFSSAILGITQVFC
jgi:hypothetical protein